MSCQWLREAKRKVWLLIRFLLVCICAINRVILPVVVQLEANPAYSPVRVGQQVPRSLLDDECHVLIVIAPIHQKGLGLEAATSRRHCHAIHDLNALTVQTGFLMVAEGTLVDSIGAVGDAMTKHTQAQTHTHTRSKVKLKHSLAA